jgi:hypothetical protein
MNGNNIIWALVCSAQLAFVASAHAGERPSVDRRTGLLELPLSDLRKAAERGDRAELARVATRLGPARVAKALQEADRRTVLAALEAVPVLSSGLLLLQDILPLLTATDDGVRARAVATTSALMATNDGARFEELEVTEETAQATCKSLAAVAANESESLPTRLLAVQGLSDAPAPCVATRKSVELWTARAPEIRRAAVLALLPNSAPVGALAAAMKDRDGSVAAAAGARLCEQRAKNQPLPAEPPLRQLALAEAALPEDVVAMLPCLAASADPADQSALAELQAHGATTVRETVRRLRETNAAR